MKKIITFCAVFLFVFTPAIFSASEENELIDEIERSIDNEDANYSSRTEEEVVKLVEGKIVKVGPDYVVLKDSSEKEVKLVVDAETVIFIDEVKKDLSDLNEGDYGFSFYIKEDGMNKCDHIDVLRD